MLLGAGTRSFGGKTVAQTAEIFSKAGLGVAELCFCQTDLSGWKYNFSGKAEIPSAGDVKNAVNTFADYGISVCALGFYGCFCGASDVDMMNTLHCFTRYCDIAFDCGIRTVATHSGSAGFLPFSRVADKTLKDKLLNCFVYACIEAHKRGLTLSLECSKADVICGYNGFLEICDHVKAAIGSCDMLKYTCVPVDDGDIPEGGTIGICHIKDRKSDGRFYERPGDGDFDFSDFFGFARKNPDIPLILEYINSENVYRTVNEVSASLKRGI